MNFWRTIAFALGIVCLAWLIRSININDMSQLYSKISWSRALPFAVIFPVAVGFDALAWNLVLKGTAFCKIWFIRLWQLLILADAMQVLTPFGSFAGEPVKVLLLHKRYHIRMADGAASLIAMQVLLAVSQVPFVLVGLVFTLQKHILSAQLETFSIVFILIIIIFLIVMMIALHQQWLTILMPRVFHRYVDVISRIQHVLGELVREDRIYFGFGLLLTFVNWMLFAVELWAMCWVLGIPISFMDAWAIETLITLVRSATFFVPGHLGAQDGATTFAFAAFTHNPALGLACALFRRVRELVWAVIGAIIGGRLGWTRSTGVQAK